MMQKFIVALIVFTAAVYAVQRYAPIRLTRKFSAWLGATLSMIGCTRAAEVLNRESPAGTSCGSGCGSCGACGDDAAPAAMPAANAPAVVKFHRR